MPKDTEGGNYGKSEGLLCFEVTVHQLNEARTVTQAAGSGQNGSSQSTEEPLNVMFLLPSGLYDAGSNAFPDIII